MVGKSQRLKQARAEVQDEISAYKQQREDECKKQEAEARIHLLTSDVERRHCMLISVTRDGTGSPGHGSVGHRVSNLGPGRIGSWVKALPRHFDPDSCSML